MATFLSSISPVGKIADTPLRRAGLILAGVGIIALGAKTQVPFLPVPMTLQTLALLTVFALSGLRLSLEIVFAYLLAGLAGLPVFAGPLAGPLYFAGPTAGYLLGFVAAAAIVGWAADRGVTKRPVALFGTMLLADSAVFALGFIWLAFLFTTSSGATLGANYAFANGVLPFIAGDLVKILLATIAVSGISFGLKSRR